MLLTSKLCSSPCVRQMASRCGSRGRTTQCFSFSSLVQGKVDQNVTELVRWQRKDFDRVGKVGALLDYACLCNASASLICPPPLRARVIAMNKSSWGIQRKAQRRQWLPQGHRSEVNRRAASVWRRGGEGGVGSALCGLAMFWMRYTHESCGSRGVKLSALTQSQRRLPSPFVGASGLSGVRDGRR